jgi:thiamine pyrophosphokinase
VFEEKRMKLEVHIAGTVGDLDSSSEETVQK